jgi:hypothetical protein
MVVVDEDRWLSATVVDLLGHQRPLDREPVVSLP